MKILIGADPELFVKKEKMFHSAHNLVPGTKKAPYPVPDGAVQIDGMALEFNIAPAKEEKEFVHNVESVLKSLRAMVPNEYELDFNASATFSSAHMREQPKEALELGCDADFDAYHEVQKQQPIAPKLRRTAGGHIHIGWTNDEDPMESSHFLSCCQIARQLDYFLGIPSVILDGDLGRPPLYGAAGSFRPKPYGVEYRVLSNFWIRSRECMEFVFSQTTGAFNSFVDQNHDYYARYGDNAKNIINYQDISAAAYFIDNQTHLYRPYEVHSLTRERKLVK